MMSMEMLQACLTHLTDDCRMIPGIFVGVTFFRGQLGPLTFFQRSGTQFAGPQVVKGLCVTIETMSLVLANWQAEAYSDQAILCSGNLWNFFPCRIAGNLVDSCAILPTVVPGQLAHATRAASGREFSTRGSNLDRFFFWRVNAIFPKIITKIYKNNSRNFFPHLFFCVCFCPFPATCPVYYRLHARRSHSCLVKWCHRTILSIGCLETGSKNGTHN